ncbi:MAG: hypothetical protein IPM23_00460 [Candidatus Melainabacteria bacterium]|nr:hypothetical protein [Candidatus Melainabacteria bacterium]
MADRNRERFLFLAGRYIDRLLVALSALAVFLAFMHHACWRYGADPGNIIASYFDLDSESTLGSWYAALLWFSVSLSSLLAWALERWFQSDFRFRFWWLVTAFVFAVASADEISMIHETAGELLEKSLASKGLGTSIWSFFEDSPWLVFYILPLLSFIVMTLCFLSDRFSKSKKGSLLLASGFASYIVALIIEFVQGMPAAKLAPLAGLVFLSARDFYNVSVVVEETLENLGTVLILVAVLWHCHGVLNGLIYRSGKAGGAE